MKNTKRTQAVIYTRYSPRRLKTGQECDSCKTQAELAQKYCDLHQLKVIGVFEDEGISGKTRFNRPGLDRALKLVRKSRAVLVVYSFSRLARSTKEMLEISESIRKAGGGLASLHENIDTTTPMGQCMFTIVVAFAELERKQTGERTSEAMRQHMKRGRRMTSLKTCPYGWKPDPGNPKLMIQNAYEQENLIIMVHLRKRGYKYTAIIEHLESQGRKNRMGRTKWDVGNFGYILRRAMAE